MPKLRLINEALEVEAAAGARLLDACAGAGIDVLRGLWHGARCRSGALAMLPYGACGRCRVWVSGAAGALNPPTAMERLHPTVRGSLRLACQVHVQGDLEVTTRAGWEDHAPVITGAGEAGALAWRNRLKT